MNDEKEDTQSSEKPAMDAPQEEFIQPEAVPSKPERFAKTESDKQENAESD